MLFWMSPSASESSGAVEKADYLQADFRRVDKKIDRVSKSIDRHDDATRLKLVALAGALEEKFEGVDEILDYAQLQLDDVDGKADVAARTVEALKRNVKDVDWKIRLLDHKMSQSEARARNHRLARLHQKIHKVTVMMPAGMGQPAILHVQDLRYFPSTIHDFWNLRKKPKFMIYLLRYYDLSGWKYWDMDLESTDSEAENSNSPAQATSTSLVRHSQTLEGAVKAYPELALREIAEELGLDYDCIESMAQEHRTARAERALIRVPLKTSNPPMESIPLHRSSPRPRLPSAVPASSVITRQSRKRQLREL